jgi:hypothetical protein
MTPKSLHASAMLVGVLDVRHQAGLFPRPVIVAYDRPRGYILAHFRAISKEEPGGIFFATACPGSGFTINSL